MCAVRPFRFAVAASWASSRNEWVAKARRAEELGYDVFLVPDRTGRQLAPVPALMAIADATSRLRIGSFVFANDFRRPLLLAKEVATLDLLSSGRVEFGLGAGWSTPDYERLGLSYDRPGLRVERLREAVRLMKRLFTEERVDFSGTHYRARRARLAPKPVQRPMPPLMIGGGGKRVLTLAAREADIVALVPRVDSRGRHVASDVTGGATARKVEWIRTAAGERAERIEIQSFVVDVAIGGAAAWAKRLPAALVDSPYFLYGSTAQVVGDLERRRERFGISYYPVPDHAMENFAPVVAALRGR
jgi:probable F420-dependent oxidoreductase